MARYANGRAPKSALTKFEGRWFFPGTLARWKALRADVLKETGKTLSLTSAYRDYDEQVAARKKYGVGAAVPGTSSHGGVWTGSTTGRGGLSTWVSGVESGALDIGNYWAIPWSTFDRLARKHGFITNIVVPKELWHVVDLDPWGHKLTSNEEEDEMNSAEKKQFDEMAKTIKEINRRVHVMTGKALGHGFWKIGNRGKKLDHIFDAVKIGETGVRHEGPIMAHVRAIYDSIRDGKKGVRTHGTLTSFIRSELGAQKIFRAEQRGKDDAVDVEDLAESLAPLLTQHEADELAKAITKKIGEALSEGDKDE